VVRLTGGEGTLHGTMASAEITDFLSSLNGAQENVPAVWFPGGVWLRRSYCKGPALNVGAEA